MRLSWFITTRSFLFSVIMHIVLISLLIISIDLTPAPKRLPKVNIVKAVAVDKQQVENELQKIKDAEKKKREAEEQRQKELEQKAEAAKKERIEEEERLKDLKKKKTEEIKKREEEQIRLKELESKRKIEEEKKKLAEEKRKLEEEKKRKTEEELKKLEEKKKQEEADRKRKAEADKRRKAENELLKQQMLEEQMELEEAQNQQDLNILAQYQQRIAGLVEREFNMTGLSDDLSCKIYIRLIPGGDVVDVRIIETSGNKLFDNRALTAVQKASPLPVPDDVRLFEKMREIRFIFDPEN